MVFHSNLHDKEKFHYSLKIESSESLKVKQRMIVCTKLNFLWIILLAVHGIMH